MFIFRFFLNMKMFKNKVSTINEPIREHSIIDANMKQSIFNDVQDLNTLDDIQMQNMKYMSHSSLLKLVSIYNDISKIFVDFLENEEYYRVRTVKPLKNYNFARSNCNS